MKTLNKLSEHFFDLFTISTGDPRYAENDKRCFANALRQFLDSGRKEDAFTVYFCFCEIFKLFGDGYENTKKLLELLSDHEYHSGELLSKHRDHYSHSVYVFALGLAIYANDSVYRNSFLSFYGYEDNAESAFQFLKFWGTVSLFHDIGYPFQLAHEQIKTYTHEIWGEKNPAIPYVSYKNVLEFIQINSDTQQRLQIALNTKKKLATFNDLLAFGLNKREGYEIAKVTDILLKRVTDQPGFMDHGYFSAVILAKQLFSAQDFDFSIQHLDLLTAILLHNSFNKYDCPNSHPIALNEHPLAYLIILCDELQCWDRLAYGKVSKRDPIAWDIRMEIADNKITIKYFFDSYIVREYVHESKDIVILNKNYLELRDDVFVEKICGSKYVYGAGYTKDEAKEKGRKFYEGFLSTDLRIIAQTGEKQKAKKAGVYASDDNFINLCDLAKAIHASYNEHCMSLSESRIDEDFAKLALEFKVSNIEQAKSYSQKLELINCFYSSKDLDYPVIEDFNSKMEGDSTNKLEFLCHEEHVRWVKEKLAMGWTYGTDYTDVEERNVKKIHKSLVPYEILPDSEKAKNQLMVNNIIYLLKKFSSNIKIYNYRVGTKPRLEIAGTGHRFFINDPETLKPQIKEILSNYKQTHDVIVHTCFAYGADQLIAECATELGITIQADLPMDYEAYIEDVRRDAEKNGHPFTKEDELRMRHLLAQTAKCEVLLDPVHTYSKANEYFLDHCQKLIAIWDGKPLDLVDKDGKFINKGGTYDCIKLAESKGLKMKEDIFIIDCYR